jgi:hypothetical protein
MLISWLRIVIRMDDKCCIFFTSKLLLDCSDIISFPSQDANCFMIKISCNSKFTTTLTKIQWIWKPKDALLHKLVLFGSDSLGRAIRSISKTIYVTHKPSFLAWNVVDVLTPFPSIYSNVNVRGSPFIRWKSKYESVLQRAGCTQVWYRWDLVPILGVSDGA